MVLLVQQLPVEDAVHQQVPFVRNFVLLGHEQRWNDEHTTKDAPGANRTNVLRRAPR